MKVEYKITKGWRILANGTILKKGDRFAGIGRWTLTDLVGLEVGKLFTANLYIRKNTTKRRSRKQKITP